MLAFPNSSLVVDAGIALVVVLPHPYREHGKRFWQRWVATPRPLLAPHLWVAEVTSGLRRAVWESILTPAEAEQALEHLLRLPITFVPDAHLASGALVWAGQLQQKRAYDAFYVALAEARGAEFWSADNRLVRALRQQGHTWAHWIGDVGKNEEEPTKPQS